MKKGNTPVLAAYSIARNEEEYIEKNIRSVLNQTYPITRYLIIDDMSDDGTPKIIQKYVGEKVKYLLSNVEIQEEVFSNEGIQVRPKQRTAACYLLGLQEITDLVPDWRYLLRVDGDTWLSPDFCEKLIDRMEDNRQLGFTGGRFVKTPESVEVSSPFHVRGSNWIISRRFLKQVEKRFPRFKDSRYITSLTVLKQCAKILGWQYRSFPAVAYGRPTHTKKYNEIWIGMRNYYRHGHPFIRLLAKFLKNPSPENLKQMMGWTYALLTNKERLFDPAEVQQLRYWFYRHALWRIRKKIFGGNPSNDSDFI